MAHLGLVTRRRHRMAAKHRSGPAPRLRNGSFIWTSNLPEYNDETVIISRNFMKNDEKPTADLGLNDKAAQTGEAMRDSSVRNFLWLFGGTGVSAVLKLVVLAVLGRLLTPEDFGIVAAALTVVALAEVFARVGIAPSIVQAKELTTEMIKTAMLSTLIAGLAISVLVFNLAGLIAELFAMPGLVSFVQVFSLLFAIRSAGLVSEALLQRRMRFRALAGIEVFTYMFGYAAVAISLAVLGFGPWSLVAGQITQVGLQTGLYLRLAPDAMQLGFHLDRFRQMLRFGLGITLSQVANYCAQNADYFIVGRFLGTASLGYYTRAYLLLAQPAQLVGATADKVLFPAMSAVQSEQKRLRRGLNLALKFCALVQIPTTIMLIVAAPEVIAVLMGDQWDAVVLPFQILISALYFRTAYKFVGTILRASGKVFYNAAWQWSYALLVVIGAVAGMAWGLEGVATGVSIAVMSCFTMGLILVHRLLGISSAAGLGALLRYAAMGVVQLGVLLMFKSWLLRYDIADALILLLLSAACLAGFMAALRIFPSLFGEEGQLLDTYIRKMTGRIRPRRSNGS
ncbi:lipopolysaccharide biosynthesis protein [Gymnodinialimonas ceratoperidinii]|uniref:Lipopolysaccharide biosynthesis protein n=1 Tax=Gymnodinialimonas ceratoperidinii TaxID=2856823 RepID=A0A8F6TXB1_9RHOB|nr:lipopolysaccharide biosynthesis protein [Gymnodinialimonas ceratoperidinii]QXT39452.1 lipopolysaccharide biosynthesis protein [Gymnodinialimonas ceratoperidinii]